MLHKKATFLIIYTLYICKKKIKREIMKALLVKFLNRNKKFNVNDLI